MTKNVCASWGHNQQSELEALCETLRDMPELNAKQAIKLAAFHANAPSKPGTEVPTLEQRYAMPGDDCAAFKTPQGYQLFAMEGMLPAFVKNDPKAAGWSSVMVNISDIAAMGGRPTAVVNAFWHSDHGESDVLLANIKRACDVFGVAFAGGHSSIHSEYTPHLAVAILGEARRLLSCYHLEPGQRLFMLSDLTGSWHGELPYWGCVGGKTPEQIRAQWAVPAFLAESGLAVAAKDISNGGILGTLIMMLELTGCGATLDLSAIPKPDGDLLRWLRAFQSFGFLLAVEPQKVSSLLSTFQKSHLTCCPVGTINDSGKIHLDYAGAASEFWNIQQHPLTGMGA